MHGSILTNQGAMVALQTMKSINKSLGNVQDSISTGKRVATSKDNAAIWAISSVMESDVSSFKAVTDSLALGQSTVSVARNAAEQVKDSLIEIKSKIIAAQEENVDRDKIQADVDAIRSQIKSIVGASQFNGLNLLKSSEDLEVLSSLDRESNGSTSTSTINVESKSLDSGSAARSVAGTSVVAAVNGAGATVTAAFVTNSNPATVVDGKGTLGTFTNSSQSFAFSTTVALDEGDNVSFSFTDGDNTATFTYTQTAVGTAQTTGEELAKQLKNAYTAFAARDSLGAGVNIGTGTNVGDYNATTKTYTAAEGTFVVSGSGADKLNTMEMSENSGTLTVVNKRDTGIIFTAGSENDRLATDMVDVALSANIAAAGSADFDFPGTIGLQQDDSYRFELTDTAAGDIEELAVTVTGAALTKSQVATLTFDALQAFKAGTVTSTNTSVSSVANTTFTGTSTAGKYTDSVTGASFTIAYTADSTGNAGTGGVGLTETNFRKQIDGTNGTLTFTNPTSGRITIANAAANHTFKTEGDLTQGSTATTADIDVSNASNSSELRPTSGTFAFTTTVALDEGDTQEFNFSNGDNSIKITYTQTATGSAQTTGEELSAQLAAAYTAFKTGTNVGTGTAAGDFVASTNTYTGSEGRFVFENGTVGNAPNLKASLTLTDNGSGTLTVTNSGTTTVTFSNASEVDYIQTNLATGVYTNGAGGTGQVAAAGGTYTLDIGAASAGDGIQKDDAYAVLLTQDAANFNSNDARLTVLITDARLTEAQLADTVQRAFEAFKTGGFSTTSISYTGSDTSVTYGGGPGKLKVNAATVFLSYNGDVDIGTGVGTSITEATFKSTLVGSGAADLDITNGSTGQVVFTNNTAATVYDVTQIINIVTPSTVANLTIAGGTIAKARVSTTHNIVAGTVGDFLTIDVNNTANQVGDTLSITLAGVNEENGVAQPITYTAVNGATESAIATGFAAAINTALSDAGIRDVVASTRTGGLIDIKNYNITTTKDVSKLSAVNELTTAAVATDSNGTVASTIAAGATNKVTFTATTPTKGDTYSVTVGSTTAKYTARKDDTLNDIGKNIEGLLKLNSDDDITVDFTTVDDPSGTNSVLTVKNNGTSSITSFAASVKSGGTAGGGLELLDQIDVTDGKKAEGSLDLIEGLISVAIDAASSYGSAEKRLESQQAFISKLTASLKLGIGSLVDANLEKTSARLQALQVQQQLGTQALWIANQSPQSILSLL